MSFFAGIDGGGSKTTCIIGNETVILGSGSAGPSNIVRVGERQARESISTALAQACAAANISGTQIQRTCVGIAGGGRPAIASFMRTILAELVSGEVEVVGDMVIALEAACPRGPGVIVIAGTGSIAYGRNSAGQTARAGGWGFAVSDEGSGHWIGRAVLAAALRAYDEEPKTPLLDRLMEAWGKSSREEMILAANATPDFAALLPAVIEAAENEDPIAVATLTQAGSELAGLAKTVIRRLFGRDAAPVAMAGGVFRNSALVRQVFYNNLRSEFPEVALKPEIVDPVEGALELARRGALRATP